MVDSSKPRGGKGKKAPYRTMMVRIPVDLKEEVETLSKGFRLAVQLKELLNSCSEEHRQELLDRINGMILDGKSEFHQVNSFASTSEVEQLKIRIKLLELEKAELLERLRVRNGDGAKL